MAKLRTTKKDIAYLAGEIISNCYLAAYFQGEGSQEELTSIIERAVEWHNDLIARANNSPEKHNRKLNRKHFAQIDIEMVEGADAFFGEISAVCQKG